MFARHVYINTCSILHSAKAWVLLESDSALCTGFSYELIPLRHFIYLFIFNIYLFIWLHWVLVAACGIFSCSMWALSCSMRDLVP